MTFFSSWAELVRNNYGPNVAVDLKRENTQTFILLRVPESLVRQFDKDGRNVALIEGEDGIDLSKVEWSWGYGTRDPDDTGYFDGLDDDDNEDVQQ